LFKSLVILETVNTLLLETKLSPRASLVSMLLNPFCRKGEELGLAFFAVGVAAFAEEIPYVQEYGNDEIKRARAFFGHNNAAVAICLIAALHLYTDGRYLRLGRHTDQIVSLVVPGSLVSHDVATHQVALH